MRVNIKLRAFVAGAVGMVVAFGVIESTPGGFATVAIEVLGKADIPILITVVVVSTLLFAGFLANNSLRSPVMALVGVGVLAAVALAASLLEPFVAPVAAGLTVVGALGVGSAVTVFLLHAAGLRASEPVSRPVSRDSDRELRSQ